MNSNNHSNGAFTHDRALIVSPNPDAARDLQMTLMRDHWHVSWCEKFDEFLQRAGEAVWPLVLVTETSGCNLAENVLEKLRPEIKADRTQVAVFSESPCVNDTIFCFKHGAAYYRGWPALPSKKACGRRPRRARSFSTRSPKPRPRFRPNYCASCRKARSVASAPIRKSKSRRA
jgi:hypothetical protein